MIHPAQFLIKGVKSPYSCAFSPGTGTFFRVWWPAAVLCLAAVAACGADGAAEKEKKPLVPCTIEGNDVKLLPRTEAGVGFYWRGVKLRDKDLARAYKEFTEAARLVPANVDYAMRGELARTALEQEHIETATV